MRLRQAAGFGVQPAEMPDGTHAGSAASSVPEPVWSSISPFHRNALAAPGRGTYAESSGSKGVGHDTGNPVGGGRIGGGGQRGSAGDGAHGYGPDQRAREAPPRRGR